MIATQLQQSGPKTFVFASLISRCMTYAGLPITSGPPDPIG